MTDVILSSFISLFALFGKEEHDHVPDYGGEIPYSSGAV